MKMLACRAYRRGVCGGVWALVAAVTATAWAQFPQPEVTEQHKVLQKDAGMWDAEIKMWMEPGGDPMTSKGTERNRLMGGLWLITNFRGEFGGQEFMGQGQIGYDPGKKKYVGTWVDTMSTSIMTMEGEYDKANDTMTVMAVGADPETNQPVKMKQVTKYTGEDTRVMTMYAPNPAGGDEWMKVMEISYKRRPRETDRPVRDNG